MDNEERQIRIEQKLNHLDGFVRNHVMGLLDKLNGRMWKLIFAMVGILGALSISLIMALLR